MRFLRPKRPHGSAPRDCADRGDPSPSFPSAAPNVDARNRPLFAEHDRAPGRGRFILGVPYAQTGNIEKGSSIPCIGSPPPEQYDASGERTNATASPTGIQDAIITLFSRRCDAARSYCFSYTLQQVASSVNLLTMVGTMICSSRKQVNSFYKVEGGNARVGSQHRHQFRS